MPVVENNKEMVPFEHYAGLFAKIDPHEAAERCGSNMMRSARRLPFGCCTLTMKLLGRCSAFDRRMRLALRLKICRRRC